MEVRKIVREYILKTFLSIEDAAKLREDTPLFTSGIIDSVGIIKFISFLEQRFNIEFLPRELNRTEIETIEEFARVISKKINMKR